MDDADLNNQERYAREVLIRNLYASRLGEFRPNEMLLQTEYSFEDARARADMRTLDNNNVIRIWEFKLVADYSGLGQALTYLALTRLKTGFNRTVKGVLAAFVIGKDIQTTNEVLNLGLELVIIPQTLRHAGGILSPMHSELAVPSNPLPIIPVDLPTQNNPSS